MRNRKEVRGRKKEEDMVLHMKRVGKGIEMFRERKKKQRRRKRIK